MTDLWTVTETAFDPKRQHHKETVFTIGNGYLSTRGAFEEGYPRDRRATFIHGVFDAVPIVVTELANAPDWLPLAVFLDDERFSLDTGVVESSIQASSSRSSVGSTCAMASLPVRCAGARRAVAAPHSSSSASYRWPTSIWPMCGAP